MNSDPKVDYTNSPEPVVQRCSDLGNAWFNSEHMFAVLLDAHANIVTADASTLGQMMDTGVILACTKDMNSAGVLTLR